MQRSKKRIVINTGPIPALVAATGNLDVLKYGFEKVAVPLEVQRKIAAGTVGFGKKELENARFLKMSDKEVHLSTFLDNVLDRGEASVIQTAIDTKTPTVCIDEAVGRRIARLHGLKVTGSIGILMAARNRAMDLSVRESIASMKRAGIRLSDKVVSHALKLANESQEC